MSLSIVYSRAHLGIDAPLVTVETHLSGGLPSFNIVGLPEAAVRESKDRVRSALLNANFEFPSRRITVNLAPADLPKTGGRYDLAIAMGILSASGQVPCDKLNQFEFLGELALSGELRSVGASLPAAVAATKHSRILISTGSDASLASLASAAHVLSAGHLLDVARHFKETPCLEVAIPPELGCSDSTSGPDLCEVRGQDRAKRALEIAAAGGHNLIFYGPPGTGKTMLASRLPSILPPLDEDAMLEAASLHNLAGLERDSLWLAPFRSPHHSASAAALVGGGANPQPGEISLAHGGVLFLDELAEFQRPVLDALREPLESGTIAISRARARCVFPARFQLIAAMNLTRFGHTQESLQDIEAIRRYWSRLSAPFMDRIDIQVEVSTPPREILLGQSQSHEESSATVRERVILARRQQIQRSGSLNRELSNRELNQHCQLQAPEQALLSKAMDKLGLSARGAHRVIKIARSIADLAQQASISEDHLREALSFRSLDRHPARR